MKMKQAIAQHDKKFLEWEDDIYSGRELKETY